MSIATKKGDKGKTSLIGGRRISKGDPRVEAYGALDELGSVMGFARSICRYEKVAAATKAIQKELFTVSASLVATTTASIPGDARHRSTTCWIIGRPARVASGLPGKRTESYRAGMMAMQSMAVLLLSPRYSW